MKLLGSGNNIYPGHNQNLRKRAAWTKSLRTGMGRLGTPEPLPATPVTAYLPATNVHFASTSRDTLSWAQNSFSTETNKPDSKLTITHVLGEPTQNSPSTTQAKQEDGYRLCMTCGPEEMKIPSQNISEERHNYLRNKDDRKELEIITQNYDITAETEFISNYSLKTDAVVFTNEVLRNTSTEVNQYMESVPTQITSTDMEAYETANNCSLNNSSPFGPGAENGSVVGEGNVTHAEDDRPASPKLDTTTTTTTKVPTGCSDSCNAQDQYGLIWTGCPGSYVSRPCPNKALGEAKWLCDLYGTSFVGDMPDYTNCTHKWIGAVQEEVSGSCDFVTSIGSCLLSRFVQR
jgi:hypothetical protein